MAEASRGRVTITLGRTGQVVKRAGPASGVDLSDSHPVSGSKRSVRDRLGGNADSSSLHGSQLNNKRYVLKNFTVVFSAFLSLALLCWCLRNAVHIGKDDLRFKLMQKNVFRRAQSDENRKDMDLREKLSRMGQPYEIHQTSESRERIPEPREQVLESRETSILGRIPSTRSVDDLPRVTTSRSSYSPWTLDHLRQRFPDRVMGSSRGLSPPRNAEEFQRRQVNRTYDDVRPVSYMGKDVIDAPGVSTTSFVTKSRLPTTSAKPMPPGPQIPSPIPPSSIGAEQQTVEGLLHSLGLGKYTITFKAEEVDMTALKQMGENDLKELGIPMRSLLMIVLTLKLLQYPGAYHVTDEKIYNLSANNKFRGFSKMGCDQGVF
ncbi:hypothetical protein Gohar_005000 [Gossypium harknessii]|uniref:SAM domain-containing protein n=1 Tax=Gossypium harknessii TaxID=34285 RepID=A0A7J9H6P9_9ROSI|nr:hypothetical protein [Gossypium harknessii]